MSVPTPAEFRSAIRIDADDGPRRFGDVVDDWQRADFESLDPSWLRVAGHASEGGVMRAWIERPRGHSKTLDEALMVLWALIFARRRLTGVAAAADQDQAGLLRAAIGKIVAMHKSLQGVISVNKNRVVNTRSGSELQIISADAPSSFGLTPDFIVCDELTHWRTSALWESLFSAAAKRKNCLLVVICNAGFHDSWQWPIREAARVDAGWYFNSLDGPKASWITADRLDEQRRLLPSIAYERLWLNQWSAGSGDALSEQEINRAITQPGPMSGAERGWQFFAGLDLGLSRDASALAIVGQHVGWQEYGQSESPPRAPSVNDIMRDLGLAESPIEYPDSELILTSEEPPTGKLRLAGMQTWRGSKAAKLNLEIVERSILAAHKQYNFATLNCDPWQAELLMARLQRQGVPVNGVPFVQSNLLGMCSAVLSAFNDGLIDLYQHDELIPELRRLRMKETHVGVRLESPRTTGTQGGSHGDHATALSLALLAARRPANNATPTIEGKLLIG